MALHHNELNKSLTLFSDDVLICEKSLLRVPFNHAIIKISQPKSPF